MTEMHKASRLFVVSCFLVLLLSFLGCKEASSDDEKIPETTSTVTVDWSSALTVLGVSGAYIDSVSVTAAASGMTAVTQNPAAAATTATLTVPSGTGRSFTVKLTMKPTHAAKYFSASVTADLAAGVAKNLAPVSFSIGETRILVPDAMNKRLVMMDDMDGTNWKVVDEAALAALPAPGYYFTGFTPVWDVKIDSKGRIYAAMMMGKSDDSAFYGLARFDAFDDASPELVLDDYSIRSLALDETNGYVYYLRFSEGCTLFRLPLNAADLGAETPETVVLPSGCLTSDGFGMAVDGDGYIYMTSTDASYGDYEGVVKFKPGDATYTARYDMSALFGNLGAGNENSFYPWDVTVKGDYVYASVVERDNSACAVGKIIQLKKSDLSPVSEFGMAAGLQPSSGTAKEFYGPHRFLTDRNPGFYVIEDAMLSSSVNHDRVVHFEDMSGTGWKTYGESGTGAGRFMFWADTSAF